MRCVAELRLALADPAAVLAALAPENGTWIEARVEGGSLVLRAEADHPATLRRTLEDALACASAAEKGAAAAADDDA